MKKNETEVVNEILTIINSLILILEQLEASINHAKTLGYLEAHHLDTLLTLLKDKGIKIK
jgi:hypothetical protein